MNGNISGTQIWSNKNNDVGHSLQVLHFYVSKRSAGSLFARGRKIERKKNNDSLTQPCRCVVTINMHVQLWADVLGIERVQTSPRDKIQTKRICTYNFSSSLHSCVIFYIKVVEVFDEYWNLFERTARVDANVIVFMFIANKTLLIHSFVCSPHAGCHSKFAQSQQMGKYVWNLTELINC